MRGETALVLALLVAGCVVPEAPAPTSSPPAPASPREFCGDLRLAADRAALQSGFEEVTFTARFVNCGDVPLRLHRDACAGGPGRMEVVLGEASWALWETGAYAFHRGFCPPKSDPEDPVVPPGESVTFRRTWNGTLPGTCAVPLGPDAPPRTCSPVMGVEPGEYAVAATLAATGRWTWRAEAEVRVERPCFDVALHASPNATLRVDGEEVVAAGASPGRATWCGNVGTHALEAVDGTSGLRAGLLVHLGLRRVDVFLEETDDGPRLRVEQDAAPAGPSV